ncbi:N-acetylgalactosamine kinase-like [Amphiura filiformis]|uniref:N-acetylgalactosamine kinase-like n=1 Tax=Amphiura filiformis TaxID=82378 RepID=UPI003B20CF8F
MASKAKSGSKAAKAAEKANIDRFPPILKQVPDNQKQRYAALQETFQKRFGTKPAFFARAPGRVNLIGEHVDYCGYSVLPMALQQDIVMAVGPNPDKKLDLVNTGDHYDDFTTDVQHVEIDDTRPHWHQYFLCGYRGVVEGEKISEPVGMNVVTDGTIPARAGLSSSSALVCCAALATMHSNGLKISKVKLATDCMECEKYIGTHGGGMDQAICFLAKEGMAMHIEFHPLCTSDVKIPNGVTFVIASSCVEMNKAAATHCNFRVVETRIAAQVIAKTEGLDWRKYRVLRHVQEALDTPPAEMRAFCNKDIHSNAWTKNELCTFFGLTNEELNEESMSKNTINENVFELHDRARHVYGEAGRTIKFKKTCDEAKKNYEETLGILMDTSHESCRELYKCSVDELDELVEVCRNAGSLGSRLTGAGWGGCVVSMVPTKKLKEFISKVRTDFYSKTPERQAQVDHTLFATKPGPGARIYEPTNL